MTYVDLFIDQLIHSRDPLTDGQEILLRYIFEHLFVTSPDSLIPPKKSDVDMVYIPQQTLVQNLLFATYTWYKHCINYFSTKVKITPNHDFWLGVSKDMFNTMERAAKLKSTKHVILHWILRNPEKVATLSGFEELQKRYPLPDITSVNRRSTSIPVLQPLS